MEHLVVAGQGIVMSVSISNLSYSNLYDPILHFSYNSIRCNHPALITQSS